MPDYVRVRDTSGHEITVRGDVPDGHPRGVQPGMKKLDKAAVDHTGRPLAPKYRTPLGEPLPGSAPARRRATRKRASSKPVPAAAAAASNIDGRPADPKKEN